MEIVLKREVRTKSSTIGKLSIVGSPFNCHTLEDRDTALNQRSPLDEIKKVKVYGVTAIPYGRYELVINRSARFKKEMPLLLNVPGFEGIRIHSGNTDKDTEGCILLGKTRSADFIGNSRLAYFEFFLLVKSALERSEKVFITIS